MRRCSSPTTQPARFTASRALTLVRHLACGRCARHRHLSVALVSATLAVACSHGDRSRAAGDSATPGAGDAPTTAALIRVALAQDSATATALTDSLVREGWAAELGRRTADTAAWPVSVIVPGDAVLAKLVSNVLRQEGFEPMFIGVRPSRTGIAATVTPVNTGTHGMSARVRWTLSSDRRAVLVEEDPRAIENDPVPNGFVFAREDAGLIQRDSVWDAA